MSDPVTHHLAVPGARLAYDVRPATAGDGRVLLCVGSPMGAAGFASLAGRLTERMIVTYDPRGVERSELTARVDRLHPTEHADDLHRIITEIGGAPVDVFASSGGAINALELVATHPDDVATLVAHEPPALVHLPDAEAALAANRSIHEAYVAGGFGAGMARFIAFVSHQGEVPADWAQRPGPDPAAFGLPADDDGSRDDPLLGLNLRTCTEHRHDLDAIRVAGTRVVVGVGAESEGEAAHRSARGFAAALGLEPVVFPSHHAGFLGGEYGQSGDPDAFATTLRSVLDA